MLGAVYGRMCLLLLQCEVQQEITQSMAPVISDKASLSKDSDAGKTSRPTKK